MDSKWTTGQLVHVTLAVAELVDRDLEEHAETGKFYGEAEAKLPRHELVASYLKDPDLLGSVAADLGYEVTPERADLLEVLVEHMTRLG